MLWVIKKMFLINLIINLIQNVCVKLNWYLNNHQEYGYLKLVHNITENGHKRPDRTTIGTLSLPGQQLRFDLSTSFPLLTTKRVWFDGVVKELLWMLNGCTDAKVLAEQGVHIWDANGSKEFMTKQGIDRDEGDLGPIYGYQWRNFGGTYPSLNGGVDQLQELIDGLRKDPYGRRHIVCAWNPKDLKAMALPPCHCFFQMYVVNGTLSTILYQRSADMGLGVPFNIASYALLTHIVAHLVGLDVGELIHNMGDAHVYLNHIKPLQYQLNRVPKAFPTLKIVGNHSKLSDFVVDSFKLDGYEPHSTIKMDMAV